MGRCPQSGTGWNAASAAGCFPGHVLNRNAEEWWPSLTGAWPDQHPDDIEGQGPPPSKPAPQWMKRALAKCKLEFAWPNKVQEIPTCQHTQNDRGKTPTNFPRLEVPRPQLCKLFPGWNTAQAPQKDQWKKHLKENEEELQHGLAHYKEKISKRQREEAGETSP